MEKVIKFLEKHVQWLALGLGVIWVSWQAYSYVAKDPLTVSVGGIVATPGTVDTVIRDKSLMTLQHAIEDKKIDPPKQSKMSEVVARRIGEQDLKVALVKSFDQGPEHQETDLGNIVIGPQGPMVTQLPSLPPAFPDKNSSRFTVAMVPAAAPATQPAAAGAAAGGAAPVQPVLSRQDKGYISLTFTVDQAKIANEINKCYGQVGVPPNLLVAEYVRVELLREERKPDRTWSAPVIVPALSINPIEAYPGEQKPALAPALLKPALFKYKDWFEINQDLITHPPFFQTATDAEAWLSPGTPPMQVVPQPGQIVNERRAEPPREAPRAAPVRPPSRRPSVDPDADAQRMRTERAAADPDSNDAPAVRSQAPVNPAAANPGAVAGGPLAPGELLVHDATVQEGKTYRYAVRYKLFNTMWTHNAQAVAKVADTFDVDSPDPTNPASLVAAKAEDPTFTAEKMWTPPITVELLSRVYVTRTNGFGNNKDADFVVYNWKDGHWSKLSARKLTPGDPIANASKVPTPWTVVDVRLEGRARTAYVLLLDEHGVLTRRDEQSDAADPERARLDALSVSAPGAAAAAR